MDGEDWDLLLCDHPMFSPPKKIFDDKKEASLELSLSSLPDFNVLNPGEDGPAPSGRRQFVAIKGSDIIVASGSEIRMVSLVDAKLNRTTRKSYKVLHTPNVSFDIHQIALNPNGKLLAVAGAFQVAVVVLPRSGFTRLVTATAECKAVEVGQFYHASNTSSPVAKIEWHPWGEGGSTLLVMTVDGQLREYDVSVDAEEPQQTLSFVPEQTEQKKKALSAEDSSEREVASFSLGKGRADWGPLTVYAVMRSGDVYAISPYMPRNASVPSSYVHALECFVAAKQDYLSRSSQEGSSSDSMTLLYDNQQRYVSALVRQLPPGSSSSTTSRFVPMHPPTNIKNTPMRQGPFLLQPSPRNLDGSEGGEATDILYLSFGSGTADRNEGETEHLGVVLVTFQDGRVDVYLDVEKVEARWERKQTSDSELPMFAVYETIDLNLVSTMSKASGTNSDPSLLDLLQANHPVFSPNPIHGDAVYVYHAFGVHSLQLGPLLRSLALALREGLESDNQAIGSLDTVLQKSRCTDVKAILTTFSPEEKSSVPVVGVFVPSDVYLTYSIFILTSTMRIRVFPLLLTSDTDYPQVAAAKMGPQALSRFLTLPPIGGTPAFVSLLGNEPFNSPAVISRPFKLLSHPRLELSSSALKAALVITPDTLRYLSTVVEHFTGHMQQLKMAYREVELRAALHVRDIARQREVCRLMFALIERLGSQRLVDTREKVARLQERQKVLSAQLDRTLQTLMQKASPELSEHETKWFEELHRMKQEVAGARKYSNRSLVHRANVLKQDLDRLLPTLKAIKVHDSQSQKKASRSEALGSTQAFELGVRSTSEHARIGNLEDDIQELASKLDLTLGRPPLQVMTPVLS